MLLLIATYLVLGFLYAWIAGSIAREDVEVQTGVIILLLTAAVVILLSIVLPPDVPGRPFIVAAANFGSLIVMTNVVAKIDWAKSAIIAAIYTAILFLVGMGLAAMAA